MDVSTRVTFETSARGDRAVLDPIAVKAVLKALVLPPTGPLLLAVTGLLLARRYPRTGHGVRPLPQAHLSTIPLETACRQAVRLHGPAGAGMGEGMGTGRA